MRWSAVALALVVLSPSAPPEEPRPRARGLGLRPRVHPTGRLDALTDAACGRVVLRRHGHI